MKAIAPDDLFTIIYTSGTTGMPKGVMLKHSNMIHQTSVILGSMIEIKQDERMLSILPVWHVFERVFEYLAIAAGCATYYTNVRDLRDDMKKAKPTFMASAPRLWESIYNGIYTRINDPKQTPALRRGLFNMAYFFSKHFNAATRFLKRKPSGLRGTKSHCFLFKGFYYLALATILAIPYFLLDLVVLSKIREATGGELKASVSGGGALQRHVDAFFNDIGINVLEGYGMTETSPVISVRISKISPRFCWGHHSRNFRSNP